jgi:hypothetical protein
LLEVQSNAPALTEAQSGGPWPANRRRALESPPVARNIHELLSPSKAPSAEKTGSLTPSSKSPERAGSEQLFSSAGKLKPHLLQKLAAESSITDFLLVINFPVLVGSNVRAGTLAPKQPKELQLDSGRKHTQLFKADQIRELVEGASLEHSIFPVLRGPSSKSNDMYRFTLGRGSTNDIVMNDFAVSETHAYIMVARHGYAVADMHSTNGTKLNGVPVSQVPSTLKDGDQLTFGRYDFTFRTPPGLYEFLTNKS